MRVDHEIFRSPHAVELTLEERPMPVEYQLRTAEDLGETLAMWRVQTEGYTEGTDQLIGLVSQGKQYEDSPDAEWIAGGGELEHATLVRSGR